MTRRRALLLVLGVFSFLLYLWPALRAPVVKWSDSDLDLAWARAGVGIVSPVPPPPPGLGPPPHSAKPGYLLFLRAVLALAPAGEEERTIVLVQSLLLWLSIAASALFLGRRRGGSAGILLFVALLLLLRLRDSASAVMPESLSAALLLPVVVGILELPRARASLVLFGLAIAVLFWIRPNVGGVALVLALFAAAASSRWSGAAAIVTGFLLLFAPVWMATRAREQEATLRGLGHAIVYGSADYNWIPGSVAEGGSRRELERRELERAGANWKAVLRGSGPDVCRQVVWRALHGLLGTEFYDPRWSSTYERAANVSRVVTPFVTVVAVTLLLAASLLRVDRGAGMLGLLLLLALLSQNFLLISNPRFVLPFLPALYLLAAAAAAPLISRGERASLLSGALFALLLLFVALHPFALDWEWGRIESAGVTIRQSIPRGSLPESAPATLHVRIAPPRVPSASHFLIRGPGGRLLYSSERDGAREKQAITVPLPAGVLEASSRGAIELELSSVGVYGEFDYLMFPVVPPPWSARARRDGSSLLSPSTGIRAGSLDWWAHAGAD